jgi:predicted metal-dependent phosphoesterase TrpH
VKERISRLASCGVPITFDKVRAHFPEARLGKYNIFMTMLMDDECREYHSSKIPNELYSLYFKKGGIASNLKGMNYVDLEDSIDAIHSARGIAILAHPFKEIEENDYIYHLDQLVKKGIDGLEIQPGFNGKNDRFRNYAEEKGLVLTYGSDYHGACMPQRLLIGRNGNLMDFSWLR